jgi:hypothetical protein
MSRSKIQLWFVISSNADLKSLESKAYGKAYDNCDAEMFLFVWDRTGALVGGAYHLAI